MRTVLLFAVFAALAVPFVAAQDPTPPAAVSRQWTSTDGLQQWTGEFWRLTKGTLEVRPAGAQSAVAIPLATLAAADLQFLLADEDHVLRPSFALARAGFVLNARGQPLARDGSFIRIEGTVTSIISAELAIVKTPERSYAVQPPPAVPLVRDAAFAAYGQLAGKETFTAADGAEVRLYKTYLGFDNYKQFKALLLADPRPFLPLLAGESAAYRIWAEAQNRVARIEDRQEANALVREAKAEARAEVKAEAKTAAQRAEQAQQERKLKQQITDAQTQLWRLQAELDKANAELKRQTRYTSGYNQAKRRVLAREKLVTTQKKLVADLKQQLADLQQQPD